MRPRRTPDSNVVFSLPGGTEDNDLWLCRTTTEDDDPVLMSIWELDDDERQIIARGGCVRLIVWGAGTPPVAIGVYDGPLGREAEDRG